MEHVHFNDNQKKLVTTIPIKDDKSLKIIHQSKKSLIALIKKEASLVDQEKTGFFKILKHRRTKLNQKLQFIATKIHDLQLQNLILYIQASHQNIQSSSTIQEEVSLCLNEHNNLLYTYHTMVKTSQKAQKLAKYGLNNDTTTLFPCELTYERIKTKSLDYFLTIKNNNILFIDILKPYIERLAKGQNELFSAKLLLNDQQRKKHYQIAKKRFTQTI